MPGLTRLEQIGLEIIGRLGQVIHNTSSAAEKYVEPYEFEMDKDEYIGENRVSVVVTADDVQPDDADEKRCPKCGRHLAFIEDGETKRVSWYCSQMGCRNDESAPTAETSEGECKLADEIEGAAQRAINKGQFSRSIPVTLLSKWDEDARALQRERDELAKECRSTGAAEARLEHANEKLVALDGERNELERRVNHMEDLSERECAMLDDARAALRNAEAERDAARQKPEPDAGSQPWAYLMPDGAGVTGPGTCPLCAYYNGSSCEHPDGVVACQGVDAGSPQFKNHKPEPDAGDYAGVTGATGPHREEPPTVENIGRLVDCDVTVIASPVGHDEPAAVTVEKLLRVLDHVATHGIFDSHEFDWPHGTSASAEAAKAIRALQEMLKQTQAARRDVEIDARDKGAAAERDDLRVRLANCRAQLAASQAKGQRRRKELRRLNREVNIERDFSRSCLRRARQKALALRKEPEPPVSAVECWTCDYRRHVSDKYPQGCSRFLTWEACPQGKDRQEPEKSEDGDPE